MDKLNFAVIGAGRFAKNHIRVLAESKDINLAGVASRTKESLNKIKETVPKNTELTTDASKLINDEKIDCIVIATPPSTHFELAQLSIKMGKHVLLEKPMAANLKEADKLMKIVKNQNKVFMVGHQYVYNDYINYLKSNINQLGKVNFVFAEHLYPGPVRNDIGCLWDAGTHFLSIIQYLFSPGDIKTVTGKSMDILGNKLDDFTSCSIEFHNGLKASITVSWISPERTRKFSAFGNKSIAVFDDMAPDNKLKFYDKISSINPIIKNIPANDTLKNQLNHFIYCIKNKKAPQTDIEKSWEITKWLDKISREIKLWRT